MVKLKSLINDLLADGARSIVGVALVLGLKPQHQCDDVEEGAKKSPATWGIAKPQNRLMPGRAGVTYFKRN